ncbi:MAG: ABC transporter permease [Anaerolineae bacterium]|jgi:ABC-type antimicrobial peptide transport system permease subunit
MKLRDLLKTSFENLTRHKARTALTTIGVIVGILTIVTMVSLGIGVQKEMGDAFGSVGLETLSLYPVTEDSGGFDPFGQPERTKLLTPELVAQLQARDDVVEVLPFLRMPNSVRMNLLLEDDEVQVRPWGPRPSSVPEPFETPAETLAGLEDPPPGGGGVVVSDGLLTELGYEPDDLPSLVGQEVELVLYAPRGESQAFPLAIAGITERQRATVALANPDRLAMLQWWFNDPDYLANRGYDEIFVRAASLNDAVQIVNWLEGLEFEVRSLQMMLDLANRGMIIIQTMLGSVGALALLVASIGIANTMIMAVYERTREIGILKAVGAAPGQIRALFVVESSLIGLLGGVVGTIVGWLLGKGLNVLILEILRWQEVPVQGTFFVVSWWLVLAALAFATLVGLLAGLYPAARAARLPPLDALRYE